MKAFLLAVAAALVIAVVWAGVLNKVQEPVSEAFATTGVRL
jgi:xanthosine utilization system XapX-like protein